MCQAKESTLIHTKQFNLDRGALAIRRVFSLVVHDNKHEFFKMSKCFRNPRILEANYIHLISKYVSKLFILFLKQRTVRGQNEF